ncbi:MAG: sporulation protein YabP [Firmicutes bacterium]|nr:sporulation protein YabP [Bacillota bacterium]
MEEKIMFGSHEVKMVDRNTLAVSGILKIVSFDDEEFLMESSLGNIHLKGEGLELLKLDTNEGNVKIKGKINGFEYIEGKVKNKEDGVIAKLFK